MATYSQYEKNDVKLWSVKGYLGIDERTGKQKQLNKRGFTTKKEAQEFFNRAKLEFSQGDLWKKQNQNITYGEVYEEWLEEYRQDVRESTLHTTKRIFELHILPEFSKYRIRMIDKSMIQKALNKWHKTSKRYRKFYRYACKIFTYAYSEEYIDVLPQSKVKMPKTKVEFEKKKTKDFWNLQELNEFLEALQDNESTMLWIAFFQILAFTGLRRGEALALTWNDVNFKDSTLRVNKTLSLGENNRITVNKPKTETGERIVTLDSKTLKILKSWKRQQSELLLGFGFNAMKPKQLMFSKFKDNSYLNLSAPRNALARICAKYKLDMINIHGFRHTHCSLLFDAGVPMKDVKERLGHSDIKTTMNIYTHVTEESKNRSAELFEKYVNEN